MATFAEEFRSLVQEFLLVLISNYFQFFIKAQEAQEASKEEIFEYGGTHLKTDHFELGVSLETLFRYHM